MFGTILKKLRKENHITQAELANILNLDASSISKYEKAGVLPAADVLSKVAKYFDVSTDYLLGLSENEKEPTPEEWDSLSDMQKEIIALMGNMSQEQQKDLLEHAEYQFWRATHKKSQQ